MSDLFKFGMFRLLFYFLIYLAYKNYFNVVRSLQSRVGLCFPFRTTIKTTILTPIKKMQLALSGRHFLCTFSESFHHQWKQTNNHRKVNLTFQDLYFISYIYLGLAFLFFLSAAESPLHLQKSFTLLKGRGQQKY